MGEESYWLLFWLLGLVSSLCTVKQLANVLPALGSGHTEGCVGQRLLGDPLTPAQLICCWLQKECGVAAAILRESRGSTHRWRSHPRKQEPRPSAQNLSPPSLTSVEQHLPDIRGASGFRFRKVMSPMFVHLLTPNGFPITNKHLQKSP